MAAAPTSFKKLEGASERQIRGPALSAPFTLLVRTPSPHSDESPTGYLIRLAHENSIAGVRKILSLLDFGSNYVITLGWNFAQLAKVVGSDTLPPGFGYCQGKGAKGKVLVQGHRVASEHLGFKRARLCPECLNELGYVPAEWDLKACVACHRHKRMMLKNCTACGERISVLRSHLFSCHCGADFRRAETQPATDELVAVMELLHAKIVQDKRGLDRALALNFPCEELLSADLDVFCKILVQLTVVQLHRTLGRRPKGRELRVAAHLPETALVFAHWPRRFHELCAKWRDFCDTEPKKVKWVPKTVFQAFYSWIFVRLYKNLRDRSIQTLFLVKAALEYGIRTWDRSPIQLRGRAVKSLGLPDPNFVSINRAAQLLGIRPALMRHRITYGQFPGRRLEQGAKKSVWLVVDLVKFREASFSKYSGIGSPRAEKILCMSKELYMALRKSCDIPRTHIAFGNSQVAVEDVLLYRKMIVDMASKARGTKKLYCLRDVLWSRVPNKEKIETLRKIRDGNLKVYFRNRKQSFRDLYVEEDLISAIHAARAMAYATEKLGTGAIASQFGLTSAEASAVVCHLCPDGSTKRLARAPVRRVEEFLKKFAPLRWFARKAGVCGSSMYLAVRRYGLSKCLLELPHTRRPSLSTGRAIFANRVLLAQEERRFNVLKGAFLQV